MEPRPELQGNEPVKVRGAVSGFQVEGTEAAKASRQE